MTIDATVASIDGALDDWESAPDAARWHTQGGPDGLQPTPGEQLARITDGMIAWGNAYLAAMTPVVRAFTEAVKPIMQVHFDAVAGIGHTAHRIYDPRQHRRCHRCNPAGNPRPLAINGAGYRRRQRNRKKR